MGFTKWLRKGRPPLIALKALLLLPVVWILLIGLAILLPIPESTWEGEICAVCGGSRSSYYLRLGPLLLYKSSSVYLDGKESAFVLKDLGYLHEHKWVWNYGNYGTILGLQGKRHIAEFADAFAYRYIPITYSGILDGLKKIKNRQKGIEIVKIMGDPENKINFLAGAVLDDLSQKDTTKWTGADWKDWWDQNEPYLQIVYDRNKALQLINKAKKERLPWTYIWRAEKLLHIPR